MRETSPCLSGRIVHAAIVRRPIPLHRPLGGARGPTGVRNIRLLQLTAEDGCSGLGEGSTVDWLAGPASVNVAPLFRTLVERIRADRPTAGELLLWSLDAARPASVRSALQTALLDVEGRRSGVSVASLLGADREEAALEVSALVGDDEPAAMAREASALRSCGIRCFKVKVGRRDFVADLARVHVVRKTIGEDSRLRLDANGAWTLDQARASLEALASCHAEFIEEPLRDSTLFPLLDPEAGRNSDDRAAASSRSRGAARLALDESILTAADLERAIERGGAGVLVLKLERVGGPLPALTMAERAAGAGLDVVFTDSIESAVGQAATLHVAAAAYRRAAAPPQAVGLGGLFLLDDAMDHRAVTLPAMAVKGPGLGVDIESIVGGRPS